jgi:hypothetical protein
MTVTSVAVARVRIADCLIEDAWPKLGTNEWDGNFEKRADSLQTWIPERDAA